MNHDGANRESIVLGGGCFWCLDAVYRQVAGVSEVISGYAGGEMPNPSYLDVATKLTGHAEVVKLVFDPKIITLADLLEIFWVVHDPTMKGRQLYDIGPEYRSIILYQNEEQRRIVEESLKSAQKLYDKPIVTEVKSLSAFYEAEPEHQDFYSSGARPDYCQIVIDPKLAKLRQKFTARLKEPNT